MIPEAPPSLHLFCLQFQRSADSLAALYGGPVYLVGGALRDACPRDYDVRVAVLDQDMRRLFGADVGTEPSEISCEAQTQPWQWLIYSENLKQSRILSRRFALRIDFQVQSEFDMMSTRYRDKPRVRLDRASAAFFDSGLNRGET